jgi:hypothetical protein
MAASGIAPADLEGARQWKRILVGGRPDISGNNKPIAAQFASLHGRPRT